MNQSTYRAQNFQCCWTQSTVSYKLELAKNALEAFVIANKFVDQFENIDAVYVFLMNVAYSDCVDPFLAHTRAQLRFQTPEAAEWSFGFARSSRYNQQDPQQRFNMIKQCTHFGHSWAQHSSGFLGRLVLKLLSKHGELSLQCWLTSLTDFRIPCTDIGDFSQKKAFLQLVVHLQQCLRIMYLIS